jgi:pSer/pThr/pTyr-binding forkhead associated (FHA) protein
VIITVYQNEVKLDTYNLGDLVSSNYVENFTFLIGRSSECRIILEDKKVSRNHCEVSFRGGKWILSRISKFSEVMLSGESIDEIELKESMNINISSYVLSFDLPLSEKNEASNHANLSCEDLSAPSEQELTPPDGSPGVEDEETHLQLNEEVETLDSLDDNEENNLSEDDSYPDETDVDNEGYDNNENDYDSNDSDENNFDLEEDGEDGQYEMEESVGEKTQVFTGFADYDLEIFGEFAPYDRFSIGEGECVIGREENSVDIFLHDSEVSSKHAKIIKTKVSLRIVDLNSANGTLLNGSRINESDLQSGDEFIIGSTTFTVHIRSDMIMNEKDRLLPVEDNQVVEVEEVIEVDEEQTEMEEVQEEAPKSLIGKFKKLPPKKQKIYGAVALLLIFLLLDSEEPDKAIAPNKKPNASKAVGKNGEKPGSKKTIENSLDKLTIQEREVVASKYQLAFEFIQQGKYSESLAELDYVMKLSPDYKQARSLYQMSREGLAKLEELEKKRVAEIEAKKRQDKIDKLLEKATKYVKERQAQAADGMFSKILELDPENFDVPQLKLEIDAWKKEQERIAMEKAQKDADRKRKLSQISTSRTFFGKEEWYKAILKVEEFLRIKSMDEDLVKEATEMLKTSKANLKNKISPMVGKARSLKEGQDLKAAYEQYLDVLIHEPTNVEALDELNEIRDILTMRSQRVYRDGLISESLMLFKEAKEKFQEVQQISPSDSDYYKKASLKLREYLE